MRTRQQMTAISFQDISQPLTCGEFDDKGRRRQKKGNDWLHEIVILCDREKDFEFRTHATINNIDNVWIAAINIFLKQYGFKHPIPTLYMYNCDAEMITARKINFEFDIL